MPYIRRRRPECKTGVVRPGVAGRARVRAPRPGAAPDAGARSIPTASSRLGSGSPSCARSSPRSGIPGSSGTDHRRRAHRRARRRRRAGGIRRDPRGRGPAPPAGLPPAGERARRGDAPRDGGGRGPRAPAVGPGRRLRRDDRPPRGRPRPRCGPRHRGSCSRSSSARPATRAAPSSRRRRPRDGERAARVGAARLPRRRTAHRTSNHGGPGLRRPAGDRRDARARDRQAEVGRPASAAATAEESQWARTSPSSWTWRTSSTRPRRPAWTSTTSCS